MKKQKANEIRESYYYKQLTNPENLKRIKDGFPPAMKVGDSKYISINADSIAALTMFYENHIKSYLTDDEVNDCVTMLFNSPIAARDWLAKNSHKLDLDNFRTKEDIEKQIMKVIRKNERSLK